MIPTILYEDESLVVIDKPYGVVVNRAETTKGDTIQDWFVSKYAIPEGDSEFTQKGGIVHRLDKDTSGVMVLAKTEAAYNFLKKQFLERKTQKHYQALVHGVPKQESGLISAPIERHPKARFKFAVGKDLSRMAITEWKIVQKFKDFALLDLAPHTGRTHQLRVHLQHMSHPIVSDPIYGWQKQLADDLAVCPRLFLHAVSLQLVHPVSGEKQTFTSSLPEQLQAVLQTLVH